MKEKLSKQRCDGGVVTLVLAGSLVGAYSGAVVAEDRTIDGSGNNSAHSEWGMAGTNLLRLSLPAYEDGISMPAGTGRPSTRAMSNEGCEQLTDVFNTVGATDFFWQWGQFIDHDIDLTGPAVPVEPFDIPVPNGDPFFDPDWTGNQFIFLNRSLWDPATGTDAANPRQQINEITTFIDASNVYGSDSVRAAALRTNDGTGRLKTSQHHFLPFNIDGLPNAGGPSATFFLAGDVRANEQIALTAVHTLFVREHNRLADEIRDENDELSGEEIYQRARAIVGAQLQVITYNEYLSVLLGPDALDEYEGYDAELHPGISNAFSTAAYRFGHSMLSPTLLRLKRNGHPIPEGNLSLHDAFFAPHLLSDSHGKGLEPLFRGLASQVAQDVDMFVINDVRNFLFGLPGQGGLDLVALNLQRGRDHGLPDYNQMRIDFGLDPMTEFSQVSSDPGLQDVLESMYGDIDNIDPWVGGIAEDHVDGALVGELFFTIVKDQFESLRDGDRFWYQNVFSEQEIHDLESTTLADIIRRNTKIDHEIQDHVFLIAQDNADDDDDDEQ